MRLHLMLPFPQIIGWTISFKQSRKERSVNICKHRGSFLEARDSAGLSHGEGVDKQEGITPSTVLSASNSRDVTGLAIEERHGGNTNHGYCLKKLTAESQSPWLNLHWRSPGRPPGGQLRKLKARRPPSPSSSICCHIQRPPRKLRGEHQVSRGSLQRTLSRGTAH